MNLELSLGIMFQRTHALFFVFLLFGITSANLSLNKDVADAEIEVLKKYIQGFNTKFGQDYYSNDYQPLDTWKDDFQMNGREFAKIRNSLIHLQRKRNFDKFINRAGAVINGVSLRHRRTGGLRSVNFWYMVLKHPQKSRI